ncbi:hypothetical protein GWI33_018251 [Rhynchophorus ferrugineus]|uniref:Uncharacterized protein n=1 Tax=Rhynchophorus ferrugineus TaxID=354439 RepID=A0A834HWU1_RHYFE|nr:hypothetical protein GWI33_018251 [Rhynchophorus ferrugineus]
METKRALKRQNRQFSRQDPAGNAGFDSFNRTRTSPDYRRRIPPDPVAGRDDVYSIGDRVGRDLGRQ